MTMPDATTTEPTIVLRASEVWKSYDDGAITVLKGVDFEAIQGQTVALCGPSGCGKSTLLHLLGGLDEPNRGHISVNSVELNRHRSRLHLLRYEIGFVFQLHNLIPDLTLEENCLTPPLPLASAAPPPTLVLRNSLTARALAIACTAAYRSYQAASDSALRCAEP
jgi:ABC-type lipoprotein export system ATPase subunit